MRQRTNSADIRIRRAPRRRRIALRTFLAIACLAGFAAASPASSYAASAHGTSTVSSVTPPGNSGVSQYSENLPTGGGGKSTGSIKSTGATTQSAAKSAGISASTYQQLQSSGTAGKATAALAAATGDSSASTVGKSAKSVSGTSSGTELASASPSSQIVKTIDGSAGGGIGSALPIILIASLIGISGLGLFLRRNR